MLRPSAEVEAAVASARVSPPYVDPVLRASLPALGLRMARAGMLRGVRDPIMEVGLFTVVKKVIEAPPGSGGSFDVSLRLVFDQRVPNEMWRPPPWVPLAGPGAFASLDPQWPADRPAMLGFATGDVPNFYFCLQLPPAFSSYFVLPGVRISQLTAELRELGDEALANRLEDEGGMNGFLGMSVSVMGWSWAVFLANSLLMDLLATVPSGAGTFDLSRLLVEGPSRQSSRPSGPTSSSCTSTTSASSR